MLVTGILSSAKLRQSPIVIAVEGTNLILSPDAFGSVDWSSTAVTFTSNYATNSDGAVTADDGIPNTTNTDRYTFQSVATTIGLRYMASVECKDAGYKNIQLRARTSGFADLCTIKVDLTAGSVISQTIDVGTLTAKTNGWYELKVFFTPTTTATYLFLDYFDNAVTQVFSGDGVSGIGFAKAKFILQ